VRQKQRVCAYAKQYMKWLRTIGRQAESWHTICEEQRWGQHEGQIVGNIVATGVGGGEMAVPSSVLNAACNVRNTVLNPARHSMDTV